MLLRLSARQHPDIIPEDNRDNKNNMSCYGRQDTKLFSLSLLSCKTAILTALAN